MKTGLRWGRGLAITILTTVLCGTPVALLAAELPSVVATVQGQPIAVEELLTALRGELMRLDIQRHQLLREKLDELITEKILILEASKRGIPVQQLLQEEIGAKVSVVTPEQAQAFYEANKNRIKQPFEKVADQVTAYLQQQGQEQRRQALLKELQPEYPVTIALRMPKIEIATEGEPALGPENAPVTIVEFSDFQCPYCRQVQAPLKKLLAEYEGKVKLVFRDFPLRNIHPQAQKAAEAAHCAEEQQKFWPYHDKLFATTSLQIDDLKKVAQELELNMEQFTACLDSNKHAKGIDADMRDGQNAGVNATPSFFINGYPVSGAASYERFKELVDTALAQIASAQKPN
jgi:protein-disulfide isomerase